MLKVLNHFRDLTAAERRSCLYKVFAVVMGQMYKLRDMNELCSIGTDLLAEMLVNWEHGTKSLIVMLLLCRRGY